MHIRTANVLVWMIIAHGCGAFVPSSHLNKDRLIVLPLHSVGIEDEKDENMFPKREKDNKAMAFLRHKGLIGVTKDFTNAIGIDEGTAGKNGPGDKFRKSKQAYTSCVKSGIIDNFSEPFPLTSSGSEWSGFSDRVLLGDINSINRSRSCK